MPSNPWRCADFLERVRPGIAVSIALHIGLFLALAYWLAFRPVIEMPPPDEGPVLTVVQPPIAVQPPPVVVKTPLDTRPLKPQTFDKVHFGDPPPLWLPPSDDANQATTGPTVVAPAGPPVLKDPVPIYRGALVYPDRAAEAGREGYVDFDFIIEPNGTVGEPHVVAELPTGYGFAAAAMKAFAKWRFTPMTKDGQPVAAPARIRVSFKLN